MEGKKMTTRKMVGLVFAAVLTVVLGFTGIASAVLYTTEASFLTAIQAGYYLENFDGYSNNSNQGPSLSSNANGYGWTMSATKQSGNIDTLYSTISAMSTFLSESTLIFDFTGNPVTAVGGIFGPSTIQGAFVPGRITLILSTGNDYLQYYPVNVGDFIGFTSDIPFTFMWFHTRDLYDNDTGYYPQVDHFYVGSQAAPVPIPPTVWLLGSGLIGLVGLRRKFMGYLKK